MNATLSEPCRLLLDMPRAGVENMAIDELLLRQADESGTASLRFYAWNAPTLSLGYFQPFGERRHHEGSRELPAVRRLSGGGALIHDHELTYAFCLPRSSPHARQAAKVYTAVHQALIAALRCWGIAASRYAERMEEQGAVLPASSPQEASLRTAPYAEPFLCFERRTPDDVVMRSTADASKEPAFAYKIAGSAQRRRGGALLQHGSVLLAKSSSAPELPGVRELGAAEVGSTRLAIAWAKQIAERCHLRWEQADSLWLSAAQIADCSVERFASDSWTKRR